MTSEAIMGDIKIGSPVWVFDINRRVYRPRSPGDRHLSGGPVWREHWGKHKIGGETSRSWVLDNGRKVPKTGADPGVCAFSEADIDRREWVHEHSHRIAYEVGMTKDYDALMAVAELIGFKVPKGGQR